MSKSHIVGMGRIVVGFSFLMSSALPYRHIGYYSMSYAGAKCKIWLHCRLSNK